jgi:hypothetical protein
MKAAADTIPELVVNERIELIGQIASKFALANIDPTNPPFRAEKVGRIISTGNRASPTMAVAEGSIP